MKFMKLGSKPDTFYTTETTRSVSSEVPCDLIVQVEGCRYRLHKFPMLSKCLRLQKLSAESPDSSQLAEIELTHFPGGVEAFELCAKFCYAITITLGAHNVVAARCAAEYLQMTEDAEKGNLIFKIEVFINSCIINGWKDSIVTLQSTKSFPGWSEDLFVTSRCIEAIASRVLTQPSKVTLSHSNSLKGSGDDPCNGEESLHRNKGWWGEDIAELGIDLYWRTMIAIKSRGKVSSALIGEALQIYASRWFSKDRPNKQVAYDVDADNLGDRTSKHRLLLESIVSLLPAEKGAVPTSFLLKLLKAVNVLNASSSSKTELARRAGIQLEDATVKDLLIPLVSKVNHDKEYDVDIVLVMLEQFMGQRQSPPTSPLRIKGSFERRRSRSAENINFEFQESKRSSSASHGSKLKVAKLVDGYLQEIAQDSNMPLHKMVALAEAVPDFARSDHDNLYKAIDIYLKAHPELHKSERKKLCRVLNCQKLSMEACMHAAQNELLPLRVVVQALFFEHVRAAMTDGKVADLPQNIKALLDSKDYDSSRTLATLSATRTTTPTEDQCSTSRIMSSKPRVPTLKLKMAEDELNESDINMASFMKGSRLKALCSLPRPKWMFSKLLSMNRSATEKR